MSHKVYIITGIHNVEIWEEFNEEKDFTLLNEINLSGIHEHEFTNEETARQAIDFLYKLEIYSHYCFIDEEEYTRLTE